MRKISLVVFVVATLVPLAVGTGAPSASATRLKLANRVAPSGTVTADPFVRSGVTPVQPKVAPIPPSTTGTSGCSDTSETDVRANQECTNQSGTGYLGRGQSQNETAVAVNPLDPQNVLISQNDYRRGDGSCGVDWSLDGGAHFGSGLAPAGFGPGILDNGGARHYWVAGGDTSVAFDSTGVAYLMCQVFDRGYPTDERGPDSPFGASAFMLFRSTDGGASWSFPGDYVASTGGGEDPNSTVGLLDKEYMTVDSNPNSPYRDRIYVVWANYNADFSASPIYLAYSADHGATWHQTGAVSGVNTSLCKITFNDIDPQAGACDESQYANPFIGPDGAVYVAFSNFNNCAGAYTPLGFRCGQNTNDNHSQILLVKSTDGGNTFSAPVQVGTYYDLPDCYTYTHLDFGRACVPTAPLSSRSIFRATNYPSGVALSDSEVVVDFGSYINKHSNQGRGNCSPAGISNLTFLNLYDGVGQVNGCNNDIVESTSTDGGATFSGASVNAAKLPVVNAENPGAMSDQWFQWTAASPSGSVVVSYYDRQYGDDQARGKMDYTLAVESGMTTTYQRLTDASMPPSTEFPDANGISDFMGDYTGLAVGSDGVAHPAWEDTRNPIYTFDESGDARQLIFAGHGGDIYTTARSVS